MMTGRRSAWIFTNGRLAAFPDPEPGVVVIAADGGARHLLAAGQTPDVAVGDFDSLSAADLGALRASGCEILSYPAAKDATDTEIAVEQALDRGADEITIFGGMGSRLDHSLANVLLLKLIHERGGRGRVTDGEQTAELLIDRMEITGRPGDVVSVVPLTARLEGLTIRGLRFPLHEATVPMGSSLTISNEFGDSASAEITLRQGMAVVFRVPRERA